MNIRTEKVNEVTGTIDLMDEGFAVGEYKVTIRHEDTVTYYAVFKEIERAVKNFETMLRYTVLRSSESNGRNA